MFIVAQQSARWPTWHPVIVPMVRVAIRLIDAGDGRGWHVLAALAVINGLPSFAMRVECVP